MIELHLKCSVKVVCQKTFYHLMIKIYYYYYYCLIQEYFVTNTNKSYPRNYLMLVWIKMLPSGTFLSWIIALLTGHFFQSTQFAAPISWWDIEEQLGKNMGEPGHLSNSPGERSKYQWIYFALLIPHYFSISDSIQCINIIAHVKIICYNLFNNDRHCVIYGVLSKKIYLSYNFFWLHSDSIPLKGIFIHGKNNCPWF